MDPWKDKQPPWNQGGQPPRLDEVLASLLKKIKAAFGEGGRFGGSSSPVEAKAPDSLGKLRKIAIIVIAVICFNVLYSSFYTIQPGERGVVLRLGRYAKTTSSGLNLKIPLIDEVIKVDVEKVRKEEFGFRTKVAGQQSTYEKSGFDLESLILTGDKNVIDVEWIVQYKVQDPVNFLFKIKNVGQTVRDVSEMAMRRILGNMDFDYVLSNRELVSAATAREVQMVLNQFESGLKIVTVQLQDLNPPDPVKPAFHEVNEADQDMKRMVNEAEEAYNQEIPKSRGSAKKTLEESQGYAVQRTNDAKGDAARFLSILKEYRVAKDVTRRRMYLESIRDILPSVAEIYLVDEKQQGILPLLNLTGQKKN